MNQYLASSRRTELDWLRVFAVMLLVFYHTGMFFNTWTWYIKNPETNENYAYWMAFFHAWRMPLLFFISGAGTFFAFGKLSTPQFVVERVKRLLIPLIFGMIVILPPQVYYQYIEEFDNYLDFYKSVLDYIPFHDGVPNLHHLWFLSHLFVYSIIGIPAIIFLRSPYFEVMKTRLLDFLFNPIVLLLLPPILILLTQVIFLPYRPGRAHISFYFSFFIAGMICYSSTAHAETIAKYRKLFLFASFVSLIPHAIFYQRESEIFPFEIQDICSPLGIVAIFGTWFMVIALIAYGQQYLNRSSTWLVRFSEGIYPIYVLHQTVLIVLGYYVFKLSWGINIKFWSISILTIVISALLFEYLIRPYKVMRFLFGLRPKRPT